MLRLGDAIVLKHGYAFPGSDFSADPSYPTLVTPGNFRIGGGFQHAKVKTFTGEIPAGFTLQFDDLIVTMTDLSKTGDTLGYPAFVPSDGTYLHNQRIGKVAVDDPTRIDYQYLALILQTDSYRAHVLGTASGSTVKHTSPGRILEYRTLVPPLQEQQRIAGVLGTLDDLIDTNEKLGTGLERLLSTEFALAHFDSPSDDGARLADLISINPPYAKPKEDAPYIDMAALPTDRARVGSVAWRVPTGGARFMNGDTVMARITPCLENGKTAFVDLLESDEVGIGSTEFIVLRSTGLLGAQWSYFLARSPRFREYAIQHMSGTSGRQRCPAEAIEGYPIAMPDQTAASNFARQAATFLTAIKELDGEAQQAARARDELLPLLLSGRVHVNAAESLAG